LKFLIEFFENAECDRYWKITNNFYFLHRKANRTPLVYTYAR